MPITEECRRHALSHRTHIQLALAPVPYPLPRLPRRQLRACVTMRAGPVVSLTSWALALKLSSRFCASKLNQCMEERAIAALLPSALVLNCSDCTLLPPYRQVPASSQPNARYDGEIRVDRSPCQRNLCADLCNLCVLAMVPAHPAYCSLLPYSPCVCVLRFTYTQVSGSSQQPGAHRCTR